jgi:HK97 family phage major capsid protein
MTIQNIRIPHQNFRMPRGLLAVRANVGDPGTLLANLTREFEKFKDRYDGRVDELQAAVDQFNTSIAAHQMGVGQGGGIAPVDPQYTANFTNYLRSGDAEAEIKAANRSGRFAEIQASLNVGTPSDGGYLAPIEWDRKITTALRPKSPMRRIADVVQTGVRAYTTLWNLKGWGSGWVGETAARPETSAATMQPITFANGEVYAMPASTQQLLEDSQIDMAKWVVDEITDEFTTQESLAFVSGNGTNKPAGVLTFAVGGVNAATHPGGALDTVAVASASTITMDELIGFFFGLGALYRQNASWLMNSTTASVLAKLKDSANNYLWQPSISEGVPPTLLGRPVEFDENMPSIAANALPIAFGDFKRGYLINDRLGVSILRDPYTAKPYVLFYARKRVGGGVRDPRAVRVLKMAAS